MTEDDARKVTSAVNTLLYSSGFLILLGLLVMTLQACCVMVQR